ncbi:MAG TPA: hypothetical protein VF160_03745 [Candidatus Dormibacteraeota bacterium]
MAARWQRLQLSEQEQHYLDSLLLQAKPYPPEYLSEEKAARLRTVFAEAALAGRLGAVLESGGLPPDYQPTAGDYIGNPVPQSVLDDVMSAVREIASRRGLDVQAVGYDIDNDRVVAVRVQRRASSS